MARNYYGTILNKRDKAISTIISVYSSARICHYKHAQIINGVSTVYNSKSFLSLPRHDREYVRGYENCLYHNFYNTELINGHYFEGSFYSNDWGSYPDTLKDIIRAEKESSMVTVYKSDTTKQF